MYKLGIDVGGTNTDAVLIDEDLNVVAAVKNPTSDDIYTGIMGAVDAVLADSGVDRAQIAQAMLGTTQCTNAIVERKGLAPIAILRIGAPATVGIPPMVDWADDIAAVCVDSLIIEGGFEYDGKRLAEFDEAACRAFFEGVKGRVEAVAVSSVFSTVRNDDELRAATIAREVLGEDVHVSISSEIGSMGLIERENATILNAALYDVARKFTEGFAASLADKGVTNAEVYLSQNDGTLMTMEHARRYPILTIACGPTNSIRGASYLSRRDDAIVIDVGGTTTDLGVLSHGFPRESGVAVTIGGCARLPRRRGVIAWAAVPSCAWPMTAASPWGRIRWATPSPSARWCSAAIR
ncbi:MAG: hydantoinase/oxoprolinase N-terminal domain-containing protein [Eggerthella lenta]